MSPPVTSALSEPNSDTIALLPSVEAFLERGPKPILIGGSWISEGAEDDLQIINPANEQVIASTPAGSARQVDAAVTAARQAFEHASWAKMSAHDRSRLLVRIADQIESHLEELAQIESLNNGAPLAMSRAMIAASSQTFHYYAGWPTKMYGDTFPATEGLFNDTMREALGVCGQIVPWNAPLSMAAWKIATALACGNTTVLKPAEQTPLSALRLGELLIEAGVPPGVVNIVTGLGETAGAALVNHPDVDKIAFTGSTEVGRAILSASGASLKRVTLELGGKSPNIVFADADLDRAVGAAMMGFCMLSGQVCTAGSRILVQEGIHDEFAERLVALVQQLVVGDPFSLSTMMGPLISRRQRDRVARYVTAGKADGAQLLTGGESLKRPGYFVQPTVFGRGHNNMLIAREEIFGPVSLLIPFRDETDAVRLANETDFGLAAAVWTRDFARSHRISRALKSGTVWINTYGQLDMMAPFGGYKQSGIGRELGRQSIDAYTEIKTVFASCE